MDKRRTNGGNSTKAKGVDRRKNKYRSAINEAVSEEQVVEVISACYKDAKLGDMQAAKIFLEYTVGKPKQEVEVSSDGGLRFELKDLVNFSDGSNSTS